MISKLHKRGGSLSTIIPIGQVRVKKLKKGSKSRVRINKILKRKEIGDSNGSR